MSREIDAMQWTKWAQCVFAVVVLAVAVSCRTSLDPTADSSQDFADPQAAGAALMAALKSDDRHALTEVLGGEAGPLMTSGDPIDDERERRNFIAAYQLSHRWSSSSPGTAVLEIGENSWPFPIPLVEHDDHWHFDLEAGESEILNRRIGRNELASIQACLAFVDAEREYYQRNPQGRATPGYARFILSSDGEKNGLYWKSSGGEAPSPLGWAYAAAASQGYSPAHAKAQPFHGYLYRVLYEQGSHAPGGAFSYVQGDEMTRGFALVAWPARYGSSGVTTFLVNQVGVVYEKDLGSDTEQLAGSLASFDPDETWTVVSQEETALPGS